MPKKNKKKFNDCVASLFDEVSNKENDEIYVLRYEFATNFSRLSPSEKKKAKLLRALIIAENSLYKIKHNKSDNRIYFYFSMGQKNVEEIIFCMNSYQDGKLLTWKVDKTDLIPEESLAPWHYQIKLVKIRKNSQTASLLSDQISFHETNDFGMDKVKRIFILERKYTLRDLYEKSYDKLDMDFSDYLHSQKRAHYNKCINYIINHYHKKTESDKLWQLLEMTEPPNEKKIKEVLLDNITSFSKKLLKNCGNEIIEKIETLLPYLEQELSLENLKAYIYSVKRAVGVNNANRDNFITPKSIDSNYNLIDLHTGEQKQNNGEQKYAYVGDIIVCDCNRTFTNFAVVDEKNHSRPLGKGVRNIGNSKCKEVTWSLLRSKAVQEQISAYADVNIKKICHRTILNSIYINPLEGTYHDINCLVFDLTCLVCNQKFYLNPFYMKTFVNKMTSHLKANFSKNHTDYYALSHKINAIKRSLSPSPNRKIIIIHNKATEKFVKKIKKLPASKSLCNIDVEKSIFKAISNSDICIVCLPFETVTELELAEEILKIVGENNIFIKVDDQNIIGSSLENAILVSDHYSDTYVASKNDATQKNTYLCQDVSMIECLAVSHKKINLCSVTYSDMANLIQNAAQLIYKSNYLQSTFKEFLLILSNCNIQSFKMVKCKGRSVARKKYTKKDLSIFENLQKDLIHMAYKFTPQETTYSTGLLLLNALENNIKSNYRLSAKEIWKQFKVDYCEMINSRTNLTSFLNKYKIQINSDPKDFPTLYKLLNLGVKKLNEQRLEQLKNYEQRLGQLNNYEQIDHDRVIYDWPWA